MLRVTKEKLTNVSKKKLFVISNDPEKDSLLILLKVLKWLGIGAIDSSETCATVRKCVKYIYPIFAYIATIDQIVMFSIHIKMAKWAPHSNIAHMGLCIISVVAWHILYVKEESLNEIFQTLQKLSKYYSCSSVPRCSFLKVLFVFNVTLVILVLPTVFVTDTSGDSEFYCSIFQYYVEEQCGTSFLSKLYIFIKTIAMAIVSSLFSNIISLVYCCLCYRCSVLLSNYRERIQKLVSSESYNMLRSDLCREYQGLSAITNDIQAIFSLPSLLLFLSSFMQAFIMLSRFIMHAKENSTFLYLMDHFCVHLPCGIFAFVIPACAAQVFKEMSRNRNAFRRFYEDAFCKSDRLVCAENVLVLTTLKQAKPITLSAWEMISFTGDTVPAVLGALLTYGLLALNIKTEAATAKSFTK